jgi:beta-N-acetylhexosaminidase
VCAGLILAAALVAAGSGGSSTFANLHLPPRTPKPPAPAPVPDATASPPAATANPPAAQAQPAERPQSLARLVGQKFVVGFRGLTEPPRPLLRAIRRGRVGGVILFAENASTTTGFRRIARRLQRAARAGHNPPLLIAADQEGGAVRRLPGPPAAPPSVMGTQSPRAVRATARATGSYLRDSGVNVDLAPSADVAEPSSFLGTRAFGSRRSTVGAASAAFVSGLQDAGVAATAKHYPGLGRTGAANTDLEPVVARAPRGVIEADRRVFLRDVAAQTWLVMVSSAVYPPYDPARPAVLSPRVIGALRRDGFGGVTISDDLAAPPMTARYGADAGTLATRAGTDLLLYAGSGWRPAYRRLRHAAAAGEVSRAELTEQGSRIDALKRWLSSYDDQPGG